MAGGHFVRKVQFAKDNRFNISTILVVKYIKSRLFFGMIGFFLFRKIVEKARLDKEAKVSMKTSFVFTVDYTQREGRALCVLNTAGFSLSV
jgi:hypothetical protein